MMIDVINTMIARFSANCKETGKRLYLALFPFFSSEPPPTPRGDLKILSD